MPFLKMNKKQEDNSFERFLYHQLYSGDLSGDLKNGSSITSDSLCLFCSKLTDPAKKKCRAFPKGIPDSFWQGKADHTTPYDGDRGITFTPRTS